MTDVLPRLRRLVAGDPSGSADLLHTCRMHAFGAEVIGNRSVAEALRRAPFRLGAQPHVVETAASFAVLDATAAGHPLAFFADLYDGRIGRLWRVGPHFGQRIARDPGISVAFDPRLSQMAEPVALRAEDHPGLESTAVAPLTTALRQLAHAGVDSASGSAARRTVFVLRACSQGTHCAALVSLHELTTDESRTSAFRFAAVFLQYAGGEVVHIVTALDDTVVAPWSPRIAQEAGAGTGNAP